MNRQPLFLIGLMATLFLLPSLACSVSRFLPAREENTPAEVAAPEQINAPEPTSSLEPANTPAQEAATSQEAAQPAAAEPAATQPTTGSTLRMTEEQLTTLLREQGGDMPLQEMRIELEPGRVVLRGQLERGVVPLVSGELVMAGQLAVENNAIKYTVQEASVAGINLPDAALNTLNQRVDSALREANFGDHVRSITVNEGELIIEQGE